MSLLELVKPESAEGIVKELYSLFPGNNPPAPFRLLSASPEFMKVQASFLAYFRTHPRLTFPLLTAIRYLAAVQSKHTACIELNRNLLVALGCTEQEVEDMQTNPGQSPLEDAERGLLVLMAKVIRDPESVCSEDVAAAKTYGWTDADIFDAANHAALVMSSSFLARAFMKK